jgi:hypothetical protein
MVDRFPYSEMVGVTPQRVEHWAFHIFISPENTFIEVTENMPLPYNVVNIEPYPRNTSFIPKTCTQAINTVCAVCSEMKREHLPDGKRTLAYCGQNHWNGGSPPRWNVV